MARKKTAKLKNKLNKFCFSKTRIICFLLIFAVIIGCGYIFQAPIENYLNVGLSATELSLDEKGLNVHFIDVGQGDAIVIEFPDDKIMLIDAGPSTAKTNLLSYIDNNIFENGASKTFDYVMLTHSDADHCGSMLSIYENYQVNQTYRPEIYTNNDCDSQFNKTGKLSITTKIYSNVVKAMYDELNSNVIFSFEGQEINGGQGENSYSVKFYGPQKSWYGAGETNDFSPVIILTYKQKTVFLSGDAGTTAEADVATKYGATLPKVDIYKMGHHGSSTSNTDALISIIKPTYAIACAGLNNSYGHPTQTALDVLKNNGTLESNIYRTDVNGNVLFNIRTDSNIAIFCNVKNKVVYIYVEYLMLIVIIFSFNICFVKIKP